MPERQCIAYHEAGHAVACLALEVPFEYVCVVPQGNAAGHAAMPSPGDSRTAVEAYVVITLAGFWAQALLTGTGAGDECDLQLAKELIARLADDPAEQKRLFSRADERARDIAGYFLPEINVVAAELQRRPCLTRDHVREAIPRSSLVDPSERRYSSWWTRE